MREHPILFSAPMVRAILAGRKTQTRRVIGRLRGVGAVTEFGPSTTPGYAWHFRDKGMRWHDLRHDELMGRLPHQVSGRLWVREAWHAARSLDRTPPRDIPRDADIEFDATKRSYAEIGLIGKPRPSMFMPRWASRITLVVTDVRVQRLQDISEADAVAEGIIYGNVIIGSDGSTGIHREFIADRYWNGTEPDEFEGHGYASDAFADLWERVNGAGAWDRNPWVAAYTFDPVLCNIDHMERNAHA